LVLFIGSSQAFHVGLHSGLNLRERSPGFRGAQLEVDTNKRLNHLAGQISKKWMIIL